MIISTQKNYPSKAPRIARIGEAGETPVVGHPAAAPVQLPGGARPVAGRLPAVAGQTGPASILLVFPLLLALRHK